MEGYRDCAGKFQLELTCPPSEGSVYAEIGNRIHAYLAGDSTVSLSADEFEIARRCLDQHDEVRDTIGLAEPESVTVEKRMWYGDQWSGALDLIEYYDGGTSALIIDWKTGRTPVSPAAENVQARAYAVLLARNCPSIQRVWVALIQPMAAPLSIAEYDAQALADADAEIQSIVTAALAPNAPRTPSPKACKYCRAKSVCPEILSESTDLVAVASAPIPVFTNDQIAGFLDKADIVETFIESLRSEAKKRLQEGHQIAGFKLQAGRTSRSIEDPEKAFERAGLNPDQFLAACKVSVPTLEKIFATSNDIPAKEAKAKLEGLLGDVLISKTGAPSMVRAK